jgi:plasmid maintenance system antidote protein VapI
MIPENRVPTHPGVILSQQFLQPLGVSQVAFAAHLGVDPPYLLQRLPAVA